MEENPPSVGAPGGGGPGGGPPAPAQQELQAGGPPSACCSRRVLVLGGSGFIGISTTQALLNAGFSVCLANRGKVYWHTDLRKLPGVQHVKADREDAEGFAAALSEAAQSEPWLGVVDFSGYKPRHIKAALNGLADSGFGVYIFISTDSVYEVSDSSAWAEAAWVEEEMARRPADRQKAKVLQKMDSYAHEKLKCEELLSEFAAERKQRVVALRLADVIGPYDDTHRLWSYWWWCQYSGVSPVLMDEDGEKQPLNFTFTQDVAAAICVLLQQTEKLQQQGSTDSGFEAYNLACEETITLRNLLEELYALSPRSSKKQPLQMRVSNDRLSFPILLPSVCRQTPLCMQRIKTKIGFSALTSLVSSSNYKCICLLRREGRRRHLLILLLDCLSSFSPSPCIVCMQKKALADTCKWFEAASISYPDQAKAAIKKLPKEARLAALHERQKATCSSSNSSSSSSSEDEDDSSSSSSSSGEDKR
ncbi:hypothetical protein Efla_002196 [Eimeria flavescens]